MSTSTNPHPSAVPRVIAPPIDSESTHVRETAHNQNSPVPKPEFPKPILRLHINNARHPAVVSFIALVPDLASTIETALAAIIRYLYTPPSSIQKHPTPSFTPIIPPTRSVTILLRDIDGVAYTTGTDLDNDHKEIHLSLSYIASSTTKQPDPAAEITGVLTHELVHCYQHTSPPRTASDSSSDSDPAPRPPGGLIEGIADFVRLKAGLQPPHWKRPASAKERPDKWDEGYQHTAYFLAWLEDVRVGKGAVGMLNDRLLRVGYVGEDAESEKLGKQGFWKGLFGKSIAELWEEYGEGLDRARNSGNWEDEIVNPE